MKTIIYETITGKHRVSLDEEGNQSIGPFDSKIDAITCASILEQVYNKGKKDLQADLRKLLGY